MTAKLTAITLLALLLCGCGTSKKAAKGVPPGYSTSEHGGGRVILSPPGGGKRPVAEDEGMPGSPSVVEGQATESAGSYGVPERYKLHFEGIATEHVRIAGVNPLPESGILEVPLDVVKQEFCYPVNGHLLSPFGARGNATHSGVDIKAQLGDTIRAALPGVVRMAKYYSSYGNIIVIRHYYGFETVYAHNSENLVKVNEEVEAGDPIALAGSTGRATGTHLHFEVRAGDEAVDPEKFIDTDKRTLRSGMVYVSALDGKVTAYSDKSDLADLKQKADAKAEADRKAAEVAEARAAEIAKQRESEQSAEFHTVKSGDTLYAIALKYSTTVRKLCEINGIKESAILSIGQKIRVK